MQNVDLTLVLVGFSGVGKTSFLKTFIKQLNILYISHLEEFKNLKSYHKAILIDDANLEGLESSQLLSILETREHRTIRVLYGSVTKQKSLIQMIALNQENLVRLQKTLNVAKFCRRIVLVHTPIPFMVNLNINYTQNVNIYNSGSIVPIEHHQKNKQNLILENRNVMNKVVLETKKKYF